MQGDHNLAFSEQDLWGEDNVMPMKSHSIPLFSVHTDNTGIGEDKLCIPRVYLGAWIQFTGFKEFLGILMVMPRAEE